MKRRELKILVKELAHEYEQKPYDYWASINLPLVFEKVYKGEVVYVEISQLSSDPRMDEYMIDVYQGGFSSYFPVGYNIVVPKQKKD